MFLLHDQLIDENQKYFPSVSVVFTSRTGQSIRVLLQRNSGREAVHALTSSSCGHGASPGERDFAGVTKWRALAGEVFLDYAGGTI